MIVLSNGCIITPGRIGIEPDRNINILIYDASSFLILTQTYDSFLFIKKKMYIMMWYLLDWNIKNIYNY